MAITVTFDMPRARRVKKGFKDAFISGTIAFDNSYPDNGELATDITNKFKTCNRIVFDNFLGYLFQWDKTNKKIIVYQTADAVAGTRNAVANAADISAITGLNFIAYGKL